MKFKSFSLLLLLCPLTLISAEKANKSPATTQTNATSKTNKELMQSMDSQLTTITQKTMLLESFAKTSLDYSQKNSAELARISMAIEKEERWDQIHASLEKIENLVKTPKKEDTRVIHTVILSPDLQRLESDEHFNDIKTLGGQAVTVDTPPTLRVTERDINLRPVTAGWSLLGNNGKQSRAETLAKNPAQAIAEKDMTQARSDVNFTIIESVYKLKNRPTPTPTKVQTLLAEIMDQQMPLIEKIEKLYEVGITDDKHVEIQTSAQIEEQRKRILNLIDLTMSKSAEWFIQLQRIANHNYNKTKDDKDVVGAADHLNYKNYYLITALVLQYKKEIEEQRVKEAQKGTSNSESETK